MIYVYTRDRELLEKEEFKEKWGNIYEFMCLRRNGALYFMVYFYIEKMVFTVTIL